MNNLRSEKFSLRVRTPVARRGHPTAPARQFASPRDSVGRLIPSKVHFRHSGQRELLSQRRVPAQNSFGFRSPAKHKRHRTADRLPGLFN